MSVVMKKPGVWNIETIPFKKQIQEFFGISEVHCTEQKDPPIRLVFFNCRNVSTATLEVEKKPVVMDKDDFKWRDKSNFQGFMELF